MLTDIDKLAQTPWFRFLTSPSTCRKEKAFVPPISGVVLGRMVAALNLRDASDYREALSTSTSKRYFRGERVGEKNQAAIVDAVAIVLANKFFAEEGEGSLDEEESSFRSFRAWFAFQVRQWDLMTGYLRSYSSPVYYHSMMAVAYLRLVGVDLALRVGAWLAIAGKEPPDSGTPDWTRAKGRGAVLKEWLRQSNTTTTRDEMAKQLGYSETSVDEWLDGKANPDSTSLKDLCHWFSRREQLGESVATLRKQLDTHYCLWNLANELQKTIGWEGVEYLAEGVCRFVRKAYEELCPYVAGTLVLIPPHLEAIPIEVLAMGSRGLNAEDICRRLKEQEEDPIWRADLDCATTDWQTRLLGLAHSLAMVPSLTRKLLKDYDGDPVVAERAALMTVFIHQGDTLIPSMPGVLEEKSFVVADGKEGTVKLLFREASLHRQRGENKAAVVALRKAVELEPESGICHFQLGHELALAAEHPSSSSEKLDMLEESLHHLLVAERLTPDWSPTRVVAGQVYEKLGRLSEARVYLERAVKECGVGDYLAFILGRVCCHLGDNEAGLHWFNTSTGLCPENGKTHEMAAYCHFKLGNPAEGLRCAKKADLLGSSRALLLWKLGFFKKDR